MRTWRTEADLAELLIVRSNQGKHVRLTAETAHFIGLKLMTVAAKPTRDEIARILCSSKCERPCYACCGKANEIVRAYGHSVDPEG